MNRSVGEQRIVRQDQHLDRLARAEQDVRDAADRHRAAVIVRAEAIRAARAAGLTWYAIADALGVKDNRAREMATQDRPKKKVDG